MTDAGSPEAEELTSEEESVETTCAVRSKGSLLASEVGTKLIVASEVGFKSDKQEVGVVRIGDVGYKFRKLFDSGWFIGEVKQIRPGAGE